MSSPFELRFSCLNLAKDIQENHSVWSFNQAQTNGTPYVQPSADELTKAVIGTAHQLSLFINGDFDKLGLPDKYTDLQAIGEVKSYLSPEFIRKAVLRDPGLEKKLDLLKLEQHVFLGIEGHVVVDDIYQPKALLKYAEYKCFAEGKRVIYVADSLAAISELKLSIGQADTAETQIHFKTISDLKGESADVIIFDTCYNYNDLTLILPTHRFKQVIVYRGTHCNPKLTTDDYFANFMVNTTMHLVGDKR